MKSILHQLYDGEIAPWEQFATTLTDCRAKRQEHIPITVPITISPSPD